MSRTIECTGLRVATTDGREVLHGVDYAVAPGEILALVGESGSGKTTAALAALGHFRAGLAHTGGTVAFRGHAETHDDLLALPDAALRGVRGRLVGYVPQDPALSLNPLLRIGRQVAEVLEAHAYPGDVAERVREVLTDVGLACDEAFLRRYPHQLSGGQQQRVGIAAAFANRPDVVVLDEPTTGLDVTTQDLVLDTVRELVTRSRTAALYITHDLAVVAGLAHRVAVMQAGEVVETGTVTQVLTAPEHPYTRGLIAAVPDLDGHERAARPDPLPEGPARGLLRVSGAGKRYGSRTVLDGIDLELGAGECLMLLGESGSGKTTLARGLSGLLPLDAGTVTLHGEELATPRTPAQLRSVQYVFQSPFASLNPRRTIGSSLEVPLRHLTDLDADARRARVLDMLGQVQLDDGFAGRYPGGLSGGERQRAAIARALVTAPDVLVCDEVTSALDVSVQAAILDLLALVRRELGTAMLFVTHNIALAREVADRVAVLQGGRIVEQGAVEQVLADPRHAYTRELLEHTPSMTAVR